MTSNAPSFVKGDYDGHLVKMTAIPANPIDYHLTFSDHRRVSLNALLGKQISLHFLGHIQCLHCKRNIKTSFQQGYCFPCFKKLPQCDRCIMSPEKCHYDQGTCRDPEWGNYFCMTDHIVYLANTSGLKVGITRHTQMPTRWIDQGAAEALPIFRVSIRRLAGLIEVILRENVSDRTQWRMMLKQPAPCIDIYKEQRLLIEAHKKQIIALQNKYGLQSVQALDNTLKKFNYPILEYPKKITALSFDKSSTITGTLLGIKGQYLLLDTGVLNIRKHTSYRVQVTINP